MLRYVGAMCIFMFAFYFIYAYEKYQKQKNACGKTFLDFLIFLENEMGGLGRPMAVCAKDFSCDGGPCAPFFSALEAGNAPGAAYRAVQKDLPLCGKMDGILMAAFDSFSGGRSAVRRAVGDARARFSRLLAGEEAQRARRVRLFRTLTTASAMGLVILLL